MSMHEFIQTLTEEQRSALLKALTEDDFKPEVESRWQHEEPISEAVDGSFAMRKKSDEKPRRGAVQAQKNTWKDEGEHKDIITPQSKLTPRNRKPPKIKKVKCHICSKSFEINPAYVYGEFYRCDRCTGNK